MFKSVKEWFYKKEVAFFLSEREKEINAFLDDLGSLITVKGHAQSLLEKVRAFKFRKLAYKEEHLPGIYILFEQYLAEVDPYKKISADALRKRVQKNFPNLVNTPVFELIFTEEKRQMLIICTQFLSQVIEKALQSGAVDDKDGYLVNLQEWLTELPDNDVVRPPFNNSVIIPQEETLRIRQLLVSCSKEILERLKKVMGTDAAFKTFQLTYDGMASNLKMLDTFPAVIDLMPDEMLNEQHITLLSKNQIQNVLMQKVENLQEVNDILKTEISERKKADVALTLSEKRLANVLETAMDAVVFMTDDGKITGWNRRAEQLFGWNRNEAIGQKMMDLIIPKRYRDDPQSPLQKIFVANDGRVPNRRFEIQGLKKEGDELDVELTMTHVNIEGELLFTAFIRDITQRKESERQILEAKNKAEEANKLKSRFLANMSHEIRTPLNAILGFTDILMNNTEKPKKQKEYLQLIKSSGETLFKLLSDILDINKIEEGKLTLEEIPFNFEESLTDGITPYQYQANEKGIDFSVEFDDHIPEVLIGDPHRIKQIIINLLGNAIKFTSKGLVKISFKLRSESYNTADVIVSVSDTGIGVPKKKQKEIFESFTQADGSIKREFGGTGLGLAICKDLVEMMGGELNIASPTQILEGYETVGTDFFFNIKLKVPPQNVTDNHQKKNYKDEAFQFDHTYKILLVEDNHVNQVLAKKVLDEMNCDVVVANNGKEAIEKIEEEDFDIVLMDVQMPVMDGYEATRKIRKNGHLDIPIIGVTANVYADDVENCLNAGMDAHIGKPFKARDLFETMSSLTSQV